MGVSEEFLGALQSSSPRRDVHFVNTRGFPWGYHPQAIGMPDMLSMVKKVVNFIILIRELLLLEVWIIPLYQSGSLYTELSIIYLTRVKLRILLYGI